MSTNLRIVLLGNDLFAYKATTKLVELLAKAEIETQYSAIIPQLSTTTSNDSPIRIFSSFVKGTSNMSAKGFNGNWKSINKYLKDLQPNYGILFGSPYFDSSILQHFSKKFILAHPSLLPRYTGFDPIPHAIYNEEGATGLTICEVNSKVNMFEDALLYQEEISINESDTYARLATKLGESAGIQLNKIIQDIESGSDHLLEQMGGATTPSKPISRLISIASMTAEEVLRLYKALLGDNYQPAVLINISSGLVLCSLIGPKLYNGPMVDTILAEPVGTLYWNFSIDEFSMFIRCKEGVIGCEGLRLMQAKKQPRASSVKHFIKQYIKVGENKSPNKAGKAIVFNGLDKVQDLKSYSNFIDKKFHYLLSI